MPLTHKKRVSPQETNRCKGGQNVFCEVIYIINPY